MKKFVLSLAVIFTLGMVSCGNSNKAEEQAPEAAEIEVIEDTVITTPDGEIEAAAIDGAAAVEATGEAAAQTVSDVKEKSNNKVQEAKAKAEQAVSNAADKANEAIDNASAKVEDAAKSAADKMKAKVNKMKNNE